MADNVFIHIKHSLDLALQIFDSATGDPLFGRLEVLAAGKPLTVLDKGGGTYILLNAGRENRSLQLEALGYWPKVLEVDYAALKEKLPTITVHLTPGQHYHNRSPCYTLEGSKKGITALEAVFVKGNGVRFREYDPRKNKLTIYNPHRLLMDHEYYGIINNRAGSYEPFRVLEKKGNETELRIDHPLSGEFHIDDPIGRVIFGAVLPNGEYVLKMKRDNDLGQYLVSYVYRQKTHCKQIDFQRPETLNL